MKTFPILWLMIIAIFCLSFCTEIASAQKQKQPIRPNTDQVEDSASAEVNKAAAMMKMMQQLADRRQGRRENLGILGFETALLASVMDPHGIEYSNPDDALQSHLSIPKNQGRIISHFEKGSVGQEIGLEVGDIILKINKEDVLHDANVAELLIAASLKTDKATKEEENQFPVLVIRKGKKVELNISSDATSKNRRTYRIGVQVEPVSDLIRAHVGLKGDEGLAIINVYEGSAAAKASLQVNDILISSQGKHLGDFDQLRDVVQSSNGDSIDVEVLQGGIRKKLKLTPISEAHSKAERMIAAADLYKNNLAAYALLDYGQVAPNLRYRFASDNKSSQKPWRVQLIPRSNLKIEGSQKKMVAEILNDLENLKQKLESLNIEND